MKFKGLLIAVIVLAALGGGVYWSNKAKEAEEKAPPKDAPPKVLAIPEDQFKSIRFQKTGGDTTVVNKSDAGKWEITQPKPLPADQDSITSVVSSLSSLTSDRLIEDKAADLAPYGLANPSLQVTITKKDGKTEDLLVGDDTPTGGSTFVKLKTDPRVFSISSGVKSSLDKTSKDLRDKRLLTFDSDKLTRVELQAKGQAVEFGKNNQNEWQILKPRPLRADGSQVEDLIRKLKDAKMDTTVSDEDAKKAVSAFASGARVAAASVSDASGTQTIEVRKDKDKNYYAKSSVVEGIFKVTSDLGEGLDKDLNAFRNKKLFDFGFSDPTKITIDKTTYEKSGEKWMSGGKQMDSSSVQAVVDKLRDLSSVKFLDAGSGPVVIEAAVTSNDGKRNEKVTFMKQGATYIAKRENEPSVYELDSKAVEELQKTASEVKPYQPPKDEKKK
ncbi:MAG TPA: DUF4340 domain-containing protein [Bryobacteraceae bacterium]|nr:DUF4340 domain-containing protein [Bryobacteraceae bacterium]